MGKVIKKIGGFVLAAAVIAAGVVTGNPYLIQLGIGIAITQVVGLFRKSPSIDGFGDQLKFQKDPIAPRKIAYGKTATGGIFVYQEAFGDDNETVSTIIALSGCEITSIEQFRWGEDVVTFTSNNAVGTFQNNMFLYEHLGDDDQLADADLVANSTKWTSNHRLRGIAYVHLKVIFDAEKFDKGFLEPHFVFKGRKIYDPRKDDTNGGSGSHRLNDESTWEWSDNPVLCTIDYLMGIKVGGTLIAGMAIPSTRIDWPNVIAEANICDETVSLKAGGSEKRYTCNGIIDPSFDHRRNLEQLTSSMVGTVVSQAGIWRIYAGTPRAALKTRSVDHVFGGVHLKAKKGISEKVNSVRGLYPDINADYELKDYPPRRNATYVAEDGGLELWQDMDLPMTTSPSMAQRIAKITLERARREKQLDLTFFPIALQDQAMDTINFSYAPFNINNGKFLIADWSLQFAEDDDGNMGLLVNETLIEEDDAIYTWNPETDEADVPICGKAKTGKRINDQ